jgi:hypothetical protein
MIKKTNINEILEGREARYGSFQGHSGISQDIKMVMQDLVNWKMLEDYQREALEMISHKIARIMNGDSSYVDNWVDIAGYAILVVDILEKKENK